MPEIPQKSYAQNMDFMSRVNKYNQYIYENLKPFLGTSILDVGCGVGNVTRYFQDKNLIVGIDGEPEYLEAFRKNCKNARAVQMDIAQPSAYDQLKSFSFDTAVMTNVLEHIKDDALVLSSLYKLLPPKGKIVIVVPAYQWLFGTLDEYDLHYRRYSSRTLLPLLRSCGFKPLRYFYFNVPGILLWYLSGKILKHQTHQEKEGELINKVVGLVKLIDKITLNSLGLSLVAVAEKPLHLREV